MRATTTQSTSAVISGARLKTSKRRTTTTVAPRRATTTTTTRASAGGDVDLLNARGKKRVVITGMGAVTAHGDDVHAMYEKLCNGESAISPIDKWDVGEIGTTFAGEIKDFQCGEYMNKKMARRVDPYIAYMIVAAKRALEDAKVNWNDEEGANYVNKALSGCLIGSAMGGMQTFATATENLFTQGHKKMNPFCIPFAITNMGSALTAMDIGFMGPNYSIASACATGNFCILNSIMHIQNGEADMMLAGASDAAIIPSGMGGFSAARALSTRNDDPKAASRPWDANRDGFVMGEGAGVLVLESLESALARGAPIVAEVLGGFATCDAHHMTEPRPDGAGVNFAIDKALEVTGVKAEDVNYINAHATSTPAGDMAELRVLQKKFKNSGAKINSTKSMLGHLLGAASAVEAVVCIKAITTGELHPNINLDTPDEGVDVSMLVGSSREKHEVKVALSNSFGFGGHNSAVLFAPYKPKRV
jgi:3-oxoacyl-[acyl-carrier-protein] synthase II